MQPYYNPTKWKTTKKITMEDNQKQLKLEEDQKKIKMEDDQIYVCP